MGVSGLWDLLSPVGYRVSNEHVHNKVVAIDVSIWLTQFIKAMRDAEGATLRNAHLLGVFRRCLKLLYLAVRPVLVFDGETPALKRRTLAQRSATRERHAAKLRRIAEKLLLNQLKQTALASVVTNGNLRKRLGAKSRRGNAPALPPATAKDGANSARADDADEITPAAPLGSENNQESADASKAAPSSNDLFSAFVNDIDDLNEDDDDDIALPDNLDMLDEDMMLEMPANMQAKMLKQIKVHHRAQHREHMLREKSDPAAFSRAQISGFLRNTALNRRISSVRNAINDHNGASRRIASDSARTYVLEEYDVTARQRNVGTDQDLDLVDSESEEELGNQKSGDNGQGNRRPLDILAQIRARKEGRRFDDLPRRNRDTGRINHERSGVGWATTALGMSGGFALAEQQLEHITAKKDKDSDKSSDGSDVDAYDVMGHAEPNIPTTEKVAGHVDEAEKEDDSDDDVEWEDGADDQVITAPAMLASASTKPFETLLSADGGENDKEPAMIDLDEPVDMEKEPPMLDLDDPTNQSSQPVPLDLNGVVASNESPKMLDLDEPYKDTLVAVTHQHQKAKQNTTTNAVGSTEPEQKKMTSTIDDTAVPFPSDASADGQLSSMEKNDTAPMAKCTLEHEGAPKETGSQTEDPSTNGQLGSKKNTDMTPIRKHTVENEGVPKEIVFQGEYPAPASAEEAPRKGDLVPSPASNLEIEVVEDEIQPNPNPQKKMQRSSRDVEKSWENTGRPAIDEEDRDLQMAIALSIKEGNRERSSTTPANEELREPLTSSPTLGETGNSTVQYSEKSTEVEVSNEDRLVKQKAPTNRNQNADAAARIDASDEEVEIMPAVVEDDAAQGPDVSPEEIDKLQRELRAEAEDIRKKKATHRSGIESVSDEMYAETRDLLKLFGIPYMQAPTEAEAQCAFLNIHGLVDGIITEDSDTFLFGAKTVYRQLFSNGRFAEAYDMKDVSKSLGLSRDDLIRLAYLLGSDYTSGVRGVGVVNAMEILEAFPGRQGLVEFREWTKKVTVFDEEPDEETMKGTSLEAVRKQFCWKHRNMKRNWEIRAGFPNPAVFDAYLKPEVDQNKDRFKWGRVDFEGLGRFCWEKFGWEHDRFENSVGPLRKKLIERQGQQQRHIDEFFKPHRFAKIRSERLQKAVKGIAGEEGDNLAALKPPKPPPKRKRNAVLHIPQDIPSDEEAEMVRALEEVERNLSAEKEVKEKAKSTNNTSATANDVAAPSTRAKRRRRNSGDRAKK